MINLVYLVSSLKQAGPINQALNLMTAFDKEEINPIIVTLFKEEKSSWKSKYDQKQVEVISLNSSRIRLKHAAKQLESLINQRKINIVHSSGLSADTVNRYLKCNVLKVTTIRSHLADIGEKKNFILKWFSRNRFKINLMGVNVCVACSQALAKDTLRDLGISCECVQNGVDVDYYIPVSRSNKLALRKKLGIPNDKVVYLTVGVLYKRKQTMELLKAFLKVNSANSVFVIVGDGEEFEDLKAFTTEKKNIILVGKKSDPYEYYQCSDIFMSASLNEGLPNAVLEALACGDAVLLSDIEPHNEIIDVDRNAGATFKCGDYEELTSLIKEAEKWNFEEKSKHALGIINNKFSKYITAKNYLAIYKKYLPNE